MFNPSKPEPALNNPTQRANDVNDPQFQEQQGYFPYDLTHQEFVTPRFGEVTPTMNLHTVPGDRIVYKGNDKTVLTQINGNFMSTVNEYSDSFFVPLRSLYPINYEKLIPNPTKGDDLPMTALPKFPIGAFVYNYLFSTRPIAILNDGDEVATITVRDLMSFNFSSTNSEIAVDVALTRWFALLTMFSRGQLLDYLGYSLPVALQSYIDRFFTELSNYFVDPDNAFIMYYLSNDDYLDNATREIIERRVAGSTSQFRDLISYAIEHGYIIEFSDYLQSPNDFDFEFIDLLNSINEEFTSFYYRTDLNLLNYEEAFVKVDSSSVDITSPNRDYINLFTVLAYQQIVAQYYSNNTVDNIFNSDLYMQNLRSVLYPESLISDSYLVAEPVFYYNGVQTRFDTISFGSLYYTLCALDSPEGILSRQYEIIGLLFTLRNSLRYGDYFSTARPNMLAVGDLSINVENGAVSPIDVTKNLLMQRYLNAANYIGSGFLPYFASIFGVTPSDTGTYPRFIAHYKQVLKSDIVTNTSNNQGAQTTNLIGFSDGNTYDCFIDDYGVILVLKSYDVLPVYRDGVDRTFAFSDRFDLFNPMLQNIGDQPIFMSEITSQGLQRIFGYSMRNAELKFKISRAHGGFLRSLPGFYLPFPSDYYVDVSETTHIDPDFIRDRPIFMDTVVPTITGVSPSDYFHFIVSCTNQLNCARKIQATPPVLF